MISSEIKRELGYKFEHELRNNIDYDKVFHAEVEYGGYILEADVHIQYVDGLRHLDYDSPPQEGKVFVSCENCTLTYLDEYYDEEAEEIINDILI